MRKLLFIPALVFALTAMMSSPALAAAPTEVQGSSTWYTTNGFGNPVRETPQFTVSDNHSILHMNGALSGTCVDHNTSVVYTNPGPVLFTNTGSDTCNATIIVSANTTWQGTFSDQYRNVMKAGFVIDSHMVASGTGALYVNGQLVSTHAAMHGTMEITSFTTFSFDLNVNG